MSPLTTPASTSTLTNINSVTTENPSSDLITMLDPRSNARLDHGSDPWDYSSWQSSSASRDLITHYVFKHVSFPSMCFKALGMTKCPTVWIISNVFRNCLSYDGNSEDSRRTNTIRRGCSKAIESRINDRRMTWISMGGRQPASSGSTYNKRTYPMPALIDRDKIYNIPIHNGLVNWLTSNCKS